jgi:hypothetical protein
MRRSSKLEDDALEGRQARRIQMLNDLHNGCCFKPVQPLIAVG